MRHVLFSLILIVTYIGACAASDDSGLLSSLQAELQKVRTSTSDKPVQIDQIPDVSSLVGMKIDKLSLSLGKPDNSSEHSMIYNFYYLPITYVGGGPMLVITFDRNGTVTNVQWRGSQ